jgi:hypothetical protein
MEPSTDPFFPENVLVLSVNSWFKGVDRDIHLSLPYRITSLLAWWKPSILSQSQLLTLPPVSRQILTDASGKAWGAISDGDPLKGLWNSDRLLRHSNAKELMAGVLALQRYPLIPNSTILIMSATSPQ